MKSPKPIGRMAFHIVCGLLLGGFVVAATSAALKYPDSPRGAVADDYFGKRIADPYRWLEDGNTDSVRKWVAAQNAVAQPFLEALPQREWVKRRLSQLWSYERYGAPHKAGSNYFFTKNDGKENQNVLHVTTQLETDGRLLLDPNTLRADGTIALTRYEPNHDGSVIAYGLSDGGTDWETWKFRRTADATDLPDELGLTKFWNLAWAKDGSGVYYSRYPARADGKGDDAGRPEVYFHRLGEPQSKDRLAYAVTDHPTRVPSAELSDDGRFLVISLYEGTKTNGIVVQDLSRANSPPAKLFYDFDAAYTFIGAAADQLYFLTTQGAPRGRIIAVPVSNLTAAAARVVVPEAEVAIDEGGVNVIGDRLVVTYLKDARNVARLFGLDGKATGEVALPALGTVGGFEGQAGDPETFYAFADYLAPTRVLRLNTRANASTPFRTPRIEARTDLYLTEQVFYASKDGTRIPMFITRRRDMPRDGNQPVLLYGYGGFNVSITPLFRPSVLTWLEMGGVYAEASLRGGGEYGEAWHDAGRLHDKQNVFDDFIAAGEYLVREKYTNPSRLAIHGRSNGGLLVGAVMLQRPDLFGAALPAVGVLDMLRYHRASANARQWSTDYGLSEVEADFKTQVAYSPVHNVRVGACYPPTLVTTADRDDRVVPWHSFKFAAALQHAQRCDNPVLIRVETRAGHGAGKPIWMQIEDIADQWGFVANAIGMATPSS